MNDLVKRLRDSFTYDQQHYAPDPLLAEAADRIEELEAALRSIVEPRLGGGENARGWKWSGLPAAALAAIDEQGE